MSENKAVYIVTVGGGKCLDNTQSADGVLDCLPRGSESQKWFIETDEKDPNVVAFKSSIDGRYLRNNEPARIVGGHIGMGEKQWWTLEKGRNPGSWSIRSNACTIGASYLNDYEGVYRDRNYVHMWQMVQELHFWLDWYFMPTDASLHPTGGQTPDNAGGSPDEGAQQAQKDLEAREAALAEREKAVDDREAALKQQKPKSDTANGDGSSNKEAQQAQKDLKAREDALADKEKDLRDREAALKQQKPKSDAANGDGSSNKEAQQAQKDLKAREAALADKEKDLSNREAALKQQKPKSNAANGDSAGPGPSQVELLKAENDNLKLKLKIQDLEQQLKDARNTPANAEPKAPRRMTPSQSNGSVSGGKMKKEPVVYDCGHVAYPPPRKLNKHVVGMLYEGLDKPFDLSERQRATMAKHAHHRGA